MQANCLSRLKDRARAHDDNDLFTLIRAYEHWEGVAQSLVRQLASSEKLLQIAQRGNRLVCAQRDAALTGQTLNTCKHKAPATTSPHRPQKSQAGAA